MAQDGGRFKQIIHGEPDRGGIFQNAPIFMWFIEVI